MPRDWRATWPPLWEERDRRLRRVDLIKYTAVTEVQRLNLGPPTQVRNADEVQLRILSCILRGNLRVARPIVVLGHNFLAFLAVQILQIRLRHLAGAPTEYDLVNDRDGWLSKDTDGGYDDLQLLCAQFLYCE